MHILNTTMPNILFETARKVKVTTVGDIQFATTDPMQAQQTPDLAISLFFTINLQCPPVTLLAQVIFESWNSSKIGNDHVKNKQLYTNT